MLKKFLILCLLCLFGSITLTANAGQWSFPNATVSPLNGKNFVNAPWANDTAAEQIAYATPYGFPNNWSYAVGTACTVTTNPVTTHKFFTSAEVLVLVNGRPIKFWKLSFFTQQCVNSI